MAGGRCQGNADGGTVAARFDAFKARMGARFAAIDARFAAFGSKLKVPRRDMASKPSGMIFVATGVMLTAMRPMPHP